MADKWDYQCPICKKWIVAEGCEHYIPETGAIKLEFRKAALDAIEAENKSWAEYYPKLYS